MLLSLLWQDWYWAGLFLLSVPAADWSLRRLTRRGLALLLRFAAAICVPGFRLSSVFGFALVVSMGAQMASGVLLAALYGADPAFVLTFREEFMNEVWWFPTVYKMHVIGVDVLFTLSYLHVLKKLYLRNYAEGDADGWFTGAYAFLVFHLVVFLGITLSANHLGDVTVTIAANIFWSLFGRLHKTYAPFFTNKHLNSDQSARFALAHYVSAWYYIYLVQLHMLYVHEMWDADAAQSAQQDPSSPKLSWLWDALQKEALGAFSLYAGVAVGFLLLAHPDTRVVNYTFFEQWSEAEMEEINFFIVAPHWYFRAHMGLLTVCAQHYEGLAWLGAFYLLLCAMPHLHRALNPGASWARRADAAPLRDSLLQQALFLGFLAALAYVGGSLPCGRFYYDTAEGFVGNAFLRLSYQYLYLYLGLLAHVADRFERWYLALPAWRPSLRGGAC